MDIPEIRHYVGQHLNKPALVVAVTVCKSWNATFTPFLYSTIRWQTSNLTRKDTERQEIFRKHADYVRNMTLKCHSITESDFTAPNQFTRLEGVDMSFTMTSFARFWEWTVTFLIQNPRLNSLKLCFEDCYNRTDSIPSGFFKASSRSFQGLRTLRLFHGLYRLKDLVLLFRETSEVLEELYLNGISIHDLTSYSITKEDALADLQFPHEFPNLKTLSFVNEPLTFLQLALVERSCQLRYLNWTLPDGVRHVVPITEMTKTLKQGCSLVVELELWNDPLRDRDIAEVIEGIQPGLATISFNQSRFGPLALEPLLRQHAASLTDVSLSSKKFTVTSAMVQKILTTCHQLMRFSADVLNARDILGLADIDAEDSESEDEGEEEGKNEGGGWVCTKLTFFEMFICGLKDKPLSWHRGIFKQISKLECLEELYVGACSGIKERTRRSVFRNKTIWDGLDMRLEAGLDNLSNLKQLVGVGFSYVKQELDEKDVQWMVTSWPNLRAVYGELDIERDEFVRLAAILEERGISTTVDEPDSDYDELDFILF
ncbi:hypothetical protein BGX21_000373 [Mortierella sp. AD011]|nr:hypothetical protein BGX20_000241 [Mortierella sp. AD010]KAF9388191.1 hypothetical protein BGX21_000373 [Mortierella sp. AD011]